MEAVSVVRIEENVDRAASALLAAACAYAAYAWLGTQVVEPRLAAATAAAAVFGYVCSACGLSALAPQVRRPRVPVFDVREIDSLQRPELLLTDRFEPALQEGEEPLLLDDILSELAPDSRVVRLFDPAAMPTAGQLKSTIDRHLEGESPAIQPPDAVQALHDALAELRSSLR